MRQPRHRLSDAEQVLRSVPEKAFMATLIEAAEWLGWITYHPFDSRRDNPGYPDLTMVHPQQGRCLFIEVKREKGQLTTDQLVWLGALEQVTTVQAIVARPSNVDRVMALLKGLTAGNE